MIRCTLIFALAVAASPLWSQDFSCGSELNRFPDDALKSLSGFSTRALSPFPKAGEPDTVAVTIHIVEAGISSSVLTAELIEREIAGVNEVFHSVGLYFLPCGPIRTIKGERTYNFKSSDVLNSANHVSNTVNIYYSDRLQNEFGVPLCGFALFPWMKRPVDRYIMMAKDCSDTGVTLAHELGHFYGLYHTHETSFGQEFVNGSNCTIAGDKICDTSADPNLGRGYVSGDCYYKGDQKDARGETYDPPVSNIMSYAPSECRRLFSAQQSALMYSVHERENAYLHRNCDFYPDFRFASSYGPSVAIRSGDLILVDYTFNNIGIYQDYELDLHFSIAETAEAEGTLIHREMLRVKPGQRELNRQYAIDFPGGRGSGQYYLVARIDAYNKVVERREENNSIALPVRVDNSGLENVSLFPNPTGDELRFFLRDDRKRGRIYLRIFQHDGRLVRELPGVYKEDEEVLNRIPVADLPPGLYLLAVILDKEEKPYTFSFLKE